MAVNKVVINKTSGPETLIDLTNDTVTPETLAKGIIAHNAEGEIIVGTMEGGGGYTNQVPLSTETDGETIYNGGTGYKDGYRITTTGSERKASSGSCTGYIKVKAGDVIRWSGASNITSNTSNAINVYDGTYANLGQIGPVNSNTGIFASTGAYTTYNWNSIGVSSNNVIKWIVPPLSTITYLRVSARTEGNGQNLIVTVNEEIEDVMLRLATAECKLYGIENNLEFIRLIKGGEAISTRDISLEIGQTYSLGKTPFTPTNTGEGETDNAPPAGTYTREDDMTFTVTNHINTWVANCDGYVGIYKATAQFGNYIYKSENSWDINCNIYINDEERTFTDVGGKMAIGYNIGDTLTIYWNPNYAGGASLYLDADCMDFVCGCEDEGDTECSTTLTASKYYLSTWER